MKKDLNWMRLDNAALIFPAARRRKWINAYRVSAYLKEDVDSDMLDIAIRHAVKRFPSMAVRIRTGFFWYYLEEIPSPPLSAPEDEHQMNIFSWKEIRKCSIRVLYYKNRVSVEYFHSITDGNGAIIFLKNLVAEYIRIKYRVGIPPEHGIVDMNGPPLPGELEDSFSKNAINYSSAEKQKDVFMLKGRREPYGKLDLITGTVDSEELHSLARSYRASVTEFLTALLLKCFIDIQERTSGSRKRKNVGVFIPVNLRKLFGSATVRNFISYITPQVDPNLGDYTLEELAGIVRNTFALKNNRKYFAGKFSDNVMLTRNLLLRMAPLPLKNIAMKAVYNRIGEKKSCICLSNLGKISLPDEMVPYVDRLDFILGSQADCPINCSALCYNGRTNINFVRTIAEPVLEREFFTALRKLGLHVFIESNQQN